MSHGPCAAQISGEACDHLPPLNGVTFHAGDVIQIDHKKKGGEGIAIHPESGPGIGVYSYDPFKGRSIKTLSGRERISGVQVLHTREELLEKYGYKPGDIYGLPYDSDEEIKGELHILTVINIGDTDTLLCTDDAGRVFERPIPEARLRRASREAPGLTPQ